MAVYKSEVCIKASPQAVFDYFLDPNSLVDITLPALKLKIISGPKEVEVGSVVQFSVNRFGVDFKATHEVISIDEYCITEKQTEGAMKSFEHERRFAETADGGCRIENTITFEGPGGMMGAMMPEKRILSSLAEAFDYQATKLQERFGAPE